MATPTPRPPAGRRIAIVGGGITGLAAAHRLRELAPAAELTLFEASDRLGGVLGTHRADGYLFEQSADNFIVNVPWGLDLCRRLGIENELLPTNPHNRRALVLRAGKLLPVPEGFVLMSPRKLWPMLTTPILSVKGKLRLLAECLVPPRKNGPSDESLAAFARRRFGRETFDRLIQPLVGGIYTADPAKLSLAATMPQFLEMERRYGSLVRAALHERQTKANDAGARYGLFTAPRNGMQQLVDALAARLPAGTVRLNAPVERIEHPSGAGWRVDAGGGVQPFDALIVAAPAPVAATLLAPVDATLAAMLKQIEYAGSAVAVAGYRREQIAHPLDGFGCVVPETERRGILAISFSSNKFPGRAADDRVLLRVFFGGALHAEQNDLPDDALRSIMAKELAELLGARGEPELFRVCRWGAHMPQYHVGHLERVQAIEARAAALPNFALAGNAYRGVGVPQCIRSAEAAAERLCQGPVPSP